MLTLLKGAAFAQLASHFSLPENLQNKVAEFARRREPERAIFFLQDYLIAPSCLKGDRLKIERMLLASREVIKGVSGPEDSSTLVANVESITKKHFEKPAWMSMEMGKIDL
jgi:hypothetical protein